MEIIRHILENPRGRTLMLAPTLQLLEQTSKKELYDNLPPALIKHEDKKNSVLTMWNDHEILFRSADDEGKLRSLNLSAFHIEEGSEIKPSIFTQLKTRLRNDYAYEFMGIIGTNPENNWVRTELLQKSETVVNMLDPDYEKKTVMNAVRNKEYATHISATELNTYLPDGYIDSLREGSPEWWIKRYLEGDFSFAEGLIYPNYTKALYTGSFKPEYGQRIIVGVDLGVSDPTTFVFLAVDHAKGTVHAFHEYGNSYRSVSQHAQEVKDILNHYNVPIQEVTFIADARGAGISNTDGTSWFDNFAEYGLYFQPSTKKLDASIQKLYNYFESGKFQIHENLPLLRKELSEYMWGKPNENGDTGDKPNIHSQDHFSDALRYGVFILPDDIKDVYNPSLAPQTYTIGGKKETHLPHALQDTPTQSMGGDWYDSYY